MFDTPGLDHAAVRLWTEPANRTAKPPISLAASADRAAMDAALPDTVRAAQLVVCIVKQTVNRVAGNGRGEKDDR
jgi:hypothetical protein